jgi:hypothetical protein
VLLFVVVGAGDVIVVAAAGAVLAAAAARLFVLASGVLAVKALVGVALAHIVHGLFIVLVS